MRRVQKRPHIGDIFMMRFEGSGSEQRGWRPGVVFQNNTGNAHSPNIIALPLTSSLKRQKQPTHVVISCEDTPLKKTSMVLCENPERMSKDRIGSYIMTLSPEYMEKIAVASLLATGAISFINPERLMLVWEQAFSLNATSDVVA